MSDCIAKQEVHSVERIIFKKPRTLGCGWRRPRSCSG